MTGVLRYVDAITVPVPDLAAGLGFYRDHLGARLIWIDESIGAAGLACPDSSTEIVLTTVHPYEPNWKVDSTDEAAGGFVAGGGTVVAGPHDIPIGRLAVVEDPFGNRLVLLDSSRGQYRTDEEGRVLGLEPTAPAGPAVIIGCCNLIGDSGRYLLVRESKPSAWSRYNLPAGKPERGESLVQAAVREAAEESGLQVEVDHLVGIYNCPQTSEGFGVVNFVFRSRVVGGDLRTSAAHPEVGYFSTEEINRMVEERLVRGRHIPAAIADHERGVQLPLSLIQAVPEIGPPLET